jgi:hypothetical protein
VSPIALIYMYDYNRLLWPGLFSARHRVYCSSACLHACLDKAAILHVSPCGISEAKTPKTR